MLRSVQHSFFKSYPTLSSSFHFILLLFSLFFSDEHTSSYIILILPLSTLNILCLISLTLFMLSHFPYSALPLFVHSYCSYNAHLTTSSIVTSSASSFNSPSQLCFPYGKFSCSRQGEIACMIHGWAALPYESAVRHLESSALEKLIVLNHKRYFVSEDTQCNIVYLTFDPPVDRDVVRLGVYGTKPVDRLFCDQVQTMLNQRLIEITAKTVSRILTQNASLHASYITFLRQGGAQRHMTLSFVLPNYVQDVYFFCTIARQIFLNTQVLNRLFTNTQNIGDKKSGGKTISFLFQYPVLHY